MNDAKITRDVTGRVAERIVANELEFNGFVVRDLNLGGLAPNVDLLAVKDGKLWQIQVKGTRFDKKYENGWWFQYGFCTPAHISNSKEPMFNRVGGSFQADIVVLVCVKSPHEYQCIVLPTKKAEDVAQINLDYAYRTKKTDGSAKKPSIVWTAFYIPKTSDEKRQGMEKEQRLLETYKDKWDFDLSVPPSSIVNTEG